MLDRREELKQLDKMEKALKPPKPKYTPRYYPDGLREPDLAGLEDFTYYHG